MLLAAVAVLVLIADIATKVAVVATLDPQHPVRLLGGALYLSILRNTGAAWHLGAGYTAVLAVVAAVVIAVIIRFARRLASRPWAVALGLVLGGAAGNLVDRLFRAPGPLRGGVVDFISLFGPDGHPWPIFNLADSCLTVGVLLAVALELTGRGLAGSKAGGQPQSGPADDGPADDNPADDGLIDDRPIDDRLADDGLADDRAADDDVATAEAQVAERRPGES